MLFFSGLSNFYFFSLYEEFFASDFAARSIRLLVGLGAIQLSVPGLVLAICVNVMNNAAHPNLRK